VKLLTRETDYAIRALLLLAGEGERFVSSREIASERDIPLSYLRSVLQRLRSEKMIECREGTRGGARLLSSPATITLLHLIEIFQGGLVMTGCLLSKKLCKDREACPLRQRLLKIEKKVAKELEEITLADLM